MKLKLITFLILIFKLSFSQNECSIWTQKANFGGSERYVASGFSIGGKGYIGLGHDGNFKNDFWEYDTAANSWTQKADFPGTARYVAIGLSIGNKGYFGLGYDGTDFKQGFWEYDPTTNLWVRKTFFPGSARAVALGFSIGDKGYVGTGWDNSLKKDWWEYDPVSDSWTQKADFGGTGRRYAVGFSIGDKGYLGTGNDGAVYSSVRKDFWEYTPATNTWMRKADFGGVARFVAVGFSIGNKGYIGTGWDGITNNVYLRDFWEYDPENDIWTRKADFPGTPREHAVGFSIGSRGYIGTGWDGTLRNDFWQYNPNEDFSTAISKSDVSCYGGNNGTAMVTVDVTTAPYTYLWSNGQTFSSLTGLTAGNYDLMVSNKNGCSYLISTSIEQPSLITPSVVCTPSACYPSNGTATANVVGGTSPYLYSWSNGQTTHIATGLVAGGNYVITITDANGCVKNDFVKVSEPNYPKVYLLSYSNVTCNGECDGSASVNAINGTPPYTYQWNTIPTKTTTTVSNLCAGEYTFDVIDSWGCVNNNSGIVKIKQPDSILVFLSVTPTSCGDSVGSIAANVKGGVEPYTYSWSNETSNLINSGLAVGPYTISVTDYNGCSISKTDTVGMLTAPNQVFYVTVDSTSKRNIVIWTKPLSQGAIDKFRVYRSFNSNLLPIADISYEQPSEFIDSLNGVDPTFDNYEYAISVFDTCGNESVLSALHATIHQETPQFTPPRTYNLSWTDYKGFPFSYYYIYRNGGNKGNWIKIDSVPYAFPNQYSDVNALSDSSRYMIVAIPLDSYVHSMTDTLPASQLTYASHSNICKTPSINISTSLDLVLYEKSVSIYPNPTDGKFAIKGLKEKNPLVEMYDMLGAKVYSGMGENVEASFLKKGIYHIKVLTNLGEINKKVILQ